MANFWDRVANGYNRAVNTTGWLGHQQRMAEGIEGRVLEACCGTAQLAGDLAQRGYDVTAFDLAPRMVEEAQERLAGAGHALLADVGRLPFADACFDVALCSGSLGLLPVETKRRALAELRRISRREIRLLEPLEERPGFYWKRLLTYFMDGHRPIPLRLFQELDLPYTAQWACMGGVFTYIHISLAE